VSYSEEQNFFHEVNKLFKLNVALGILKSTIVPARKQANSVLLRIIPTVAHVGNATKMLRKRNKFGGNPLTDPLIFADE